MLINNSSDFIVGKDDFGCLEIRDSGLGNGFYYFFDTEGHRLIKQFILNISKTGIKTCCSVTFIEKEGKYSPRLEFSNRKDDKLQKEIVQLNVGSRLISSRIGLNDCYENFWALIDYIQSLKQVKVPRSGLVAISKEEKELLNRIEVVNKEFIQKVLLSFSTPEAQKLLIEAKKDDVNNLFAAVKHAKNIKALNEIDDLVIDEVSEYKLEKWIKENDWVFGIEYVRRLDATKIGIHSDADLLVESLDGFVDLIELKKSSEKLFIKDTIHKCFYPSAPLSQVLGQTIHYLGVMEDQRHLLKSEDGLNILKPRAKIVIGRSSIMEVKEKETLRKINDTLHNIEILTYDEIMQRAHRIVAHYSEKKY